MQEPSLLLPEAAETHFLEKLGNELVIDPSFLVSERGLSELKAFPLDEFSKIFLSANLRGMLEARGGEALRELARNFEWAPGTVPGAAAARAEADWQFLRARVMDLTSTWTTFPASKPQQQSLNQAYPGYWNFERNADRILADEYWFLKTHSGHLSNSTRFLRQFRMRGIATLDATRRGLRRFRKSPTWNASKKVLTILVGGTTIVTATTPSDYLLGGIEVLYSVDP